MVGVAQHGRERLNRWLAEQRLNELLAPPLSGVAAWRERLAREGATFQQWLEAEVTTFTQKTAQRDEADRRARELRAALVPLREQLAQRDEDHDKLRAALQQADSAREAILAERAALPPPLAPRPGSPPPRVADVDEDLRRAVQHAERALREIEERGQAAREASSAAEEAARHQAERRRAAAAALTEAYEALLNAMPERHDALLIAGIQELANEPIDALVLSQVSMSRVLPKLPKLPVPVLSSLPASLNTIRHRLSI